MPKILYFLVIMTACYIFFAGSFVQPLLAANPIPNSAAHSSPILTQPYQPSIKPENFSTTINHPYFSWPIGKEVTFEGETAEGKEKVVISITGETKKIMGVTTLVYWDRVWLDDVLIEETKDYLAQDLEGNVWYFGESVDNYEDGILKDHSGSWTAGVEGALPGIWMKANPQVGDSYRQEYLKGKAEDISDVTQKGVTVTTKQQTYQNCIATYDWTPLDVESKENKFYCPEVAGLVKVDHLVKKESKELTASIVSSTDKKMTPPTNMMGKFTRDDDDDHERSKKKTLAKAALLIGLGLGIGIFISKKKLI